MKRISLLSLFVKDLDAAIAFYRDKLGFVVAEDIPLDDMRWITLRFPDDDVAAVTLKLARTDDEKKLVGKQAAASPLFAIVTDDCLREYRAMQKAGVKFRGAPKVEPYGTGVMFEDLYGNQIYMNQEPS